MRRVMADTLDDVQKKEDLKELIISIVVAVLLALTFRSFAFEPFYIPSGSMKPTLLLGDYVFVSKYSYGYSRYSLPLGLPLIEGRAMETKPKRGDVIVFKLPTNTSTNYIKRLVGLPGDRIQVKNGLLYINDQVLPRRRIENFKDEDVDGNIKDIPQYVETMPNGVSYRVLDETSTGALDNTQEFIVPDGSYFFMGDNRDNSQDSRVLSSVGFVPEINLLGPANMIFLSNSESLLKIWAWNQTMRFKRFFSPVAYVDNHA